MKITIHRGQNQIGGSIIEIASDTTKIILDAGSELDEEIPVPPQIEGLFYGQPSYNAVFITHYHGDHIGLCDYVLSGIPIYIGKSAADITNAARRYLKKPEYSFSAYYKSEVPVTIGDITVTPFLCDHSAFDSYMFNISCGEKSITYSGDFRSNGRKSFPALLRRLPETDVLIIEGTTLNRKSAVPKSEALLEQDAVEAVSKTESPVFVLQAATNIDRLVTVFKTAKRSKRTLLMDLYMAEVASAAGGNIPNPKTFSGIRVFLTTGSNGRHDLLDDNYHNSKIGRKGIANERFVMCVRPSMKYYLDKLSNEIEFKDGILFYSMWEGYKRKKDIADFLRFMQNKGVRIIDLHTSGHADEETIKTLILAVKPKFIIPVHTENSSWFDSFQDISIIHDQHLNF